MLHSHQLLTNEGEILSGDFSYTEQDKKFFSSQRGRALALKKPYFVENVPMEVHIHGIGAIDFSRSANDLDVDALQNLFAEEGIIGIPTVFLDRTQLDDFCNLMTRFAQKKEEGELHNILGFALEGPVLASAGGTPTEGNWKPDADEWKKIASCGGKGLQYVVISPDWDIQKFGDVIELLLSNGIRPALGHCKKDSVLASLDGIYKAVDVASKMGFAPFSGAVITDHLFNDMPRTITHAWRTVDERRRRSRELIALRINEWNFDELDEQIGDVPAALMKLARDGMITLLLNFDGEHVDLEVSRRVYEMVGPNGIIAMTDRIDTNTLGKWNLHKGEVGALWYQDESHVAAGSSNIDDQMQNMRSLQIPEEDIWKMCSIVPSRVFQTFGTFETTDHPLSYVGERATRTTLHPLTIEQKKSGFCQSSFLLKQA